MLMLATKQTHDRFKSCSCSLNIMSWFLLGLAESQALWLYATLTVYINILSLIPSPLFEYHPASLLLNWHFSVAFFILEEVFRDAVSTTYRCGFGCVSDNRFCSIRERHSRCALRLTNLLPWRYSRAGWACPTLQWLQDLCWYVSHHPIITARVFTDTNSPQGQLFVL